MLFIIFSSDDFQLYENLKDEFFNHRGAMDVPLWAEEVVMKTSLGSKL